MRTLLAAAAATMCLATPVVALLLQRIPLQSQQPLSPEFTPAAAEAVPIPANTYLTTGNEYTVHQIKFVTQDVSRLVAHSEVHLLVATYDTLPQLDRAEMRIGGTECVYATDRNALFPNNDLLAFLRGDGCRPLAGTPTGEVELTVRLTNAAKLAVWTYRYPARESPDASSLYTYVLPSASSGSHMVRGRLVDAYVSSRFRRVDLLNYVWHIGERPMWIWLLIAAAATLAFTGSLALWSAPAPRSRARECASRAAGAAALAAALGLLYAVLVPPFQAADEPNHFIGFAAFTGRRGVDVEAARLANRGHFERIQFHPDERFGPFDVGTPGRPWDDGGNPTAEVRGSGIHLLWSAVSPVVGARPAAQLLLALRLVNVALFAATVAGFVALSLLLTDVPRPHLLAFPLFFVPTLPFFAMHVSNYALLLCAYIVMGLGVVVWFLDGRRSWTAGALTGVGWGAGVVVSRSTVPLAPLVGVVLISRVLLGGRDPRTGTTVAFWAGASLAGVAILYFGEATYLDSLSTMMQRAGFTTASAATRLLRGHPWLLVICGAAAAGVEVALRALTTGVHAGTRRTATRVAAWVMSGAAAAVVLLLGVSLLVRYPMLEAIDPARPPAPLQYVWNTLLATLTMFRFTTPDLHTSWSFWGGFGWIDTLPDSRFITGLVLATAMSMTALFLWIRRRQDARMAALVIFALCGFVGSIAAYALSVVTVTPADVHGRYLLGAYLSLLLVCWSPLALIPISRTWIPAAACMAVHGYCLSVILRRYF